MKTIDTNEKVKEFLFDNSSSIFTGIDFSNIVSQIHDIQNYRSRKNYRGLLFEKITPINHGISFTRYVLADEETKRVTSLEFFLSYNLNDFKFKSEVFIDLLVEVRMLLSDHFGRPKFERINKKEVRAYPEGVIPEEKTQSWETQDYNLHLMNYWNQDPEDCFYDEHIIKISYSTK